MRRAAVTNLEREIKKVAFIREVPLSDATRIVFSEWASKMRDKTAIKDAYDYVFGEDAQKEVRT